jgi:hypothetical protein
LHSMPFFMRRTFLMLSSVARSACISMGVLSIGSSIMDASFIVISSFRVEMPRR